MKIGLLIICTGRYNVFFNSLYDSCERFFLPNHKKTYYVFTDGEIKNSDNIVKINQENLGWPYNTLRRFKMFNSIESNLKNEDYLFFLNANMIFVNFVNDEVIPKKENNFLMGVNHPGYFNSNSINFTYERNPKSQFYIPFDKGDFYYQGCFNGGSSNEFLKMSKILDNMIDIDLSNDIMPIWHDESALNWYFLDKNPLILDPGYSYPEGWNLPFNSKIVQRDKKKFGGYNFLREKLY